MAFEDLGLLESIAATLRPVHVDLFGRSRTSNNPRAGMVGYTSPHVLVPGKTFIVLEVSGLPVQAHEDGKDEALGEVLIEGSVSGKTWFELCRISRNGTYNLADVVRAQALSAAGAQSPVVNGPARISLYKLRATVTKFPRDADGRVGVVVLGVS